MIFENFDRYKFFLSFFFFAYVNIFKRKCLRSKLAIVILCVCAQLVFRLLKILISIEFPKNLVMKNFFRKLEHDMSWHLFSYRLFSFEDSKEADNCFKRSLSPSPVQQERGKIPFPFSCVTWCDLETEF